MKKRFYVFICLVVPVMVVVMANRDFFVKSMNQRLEDEIFDKVTSDSLSTKNLLLNLKIKALCS